mgnify:CR=1 FL=1
MGVDGDRLITSTHPNYALIHPNGQSREHSRVTTDSNPGLGGGLELGGDVSPPPLPFQYVLVLGKLYKIHPIFIDAVVDLLLQSNPVHTPRNPNENENELYIVFIAEGISTWNQNIIDQLTDRLAGHTQILNLNLNTTRSILYIQHILTYIRFVNYHDYVTILTSATVVLDTYPYGGCLTTHDALSNGIPMVTYPLEHVRGRYTLGLYTQMQHVDLIASNPSHYVALVLELYTNHTFYKNQQMKIKMKYRTMIRNRGVAREWLQFLIKSWKSINYM